MQFSFPTAARFASVLLILASPSLRAGDVFLEAEGFTNPGGWVVDSQFVDLMGSPYLLAHGKGVPVADAVTTVAFPATGAYRLWVRTKDWTAPLTNHPGAFQVVVGGTTLPVIFGTVGQGWLWQDGGTVPITNLATEIRLRDLTGFAGRCDTLYFTSEAAVVPPNDPSALAGWRRQKLSLPAVPPSAGTFDVVVVGGGLAGTAAAIAAARQGLQVALIQDRPVLGGNTSQEIRVASRGILYGGIVSEIENWNGDAIANDARRLNVVSNEPNLHLFLEWRAFGASTNGNRITSVEARSNRTGQELCFPAPLFIDCTGDGWVGYWAGAQYRMGREAQGEFGESRAPATADQTTMGSSLMWTSRAAGVPVAFPAVPWATNVSKAYYETKGSWYWEYGLDRSTIYDAEEIRDHLLQAIYGTWWNVKQRSTNANLELTWVPYVAGKRESRRLVGDYLLTEADVRNNPGFPDAVVMGSWGIDLHFTKPGTGVDFITDYLSTTVPNYWLPFRCLYSVNIENLMMAGRCLSASHVGLGSPRVMNTCGYMGVAVGTAAALCKQYNTTPRGVYQNHATELQARMGIAPPPAFVTIVDSAATNGVEIVGAWTSSTYTTGYYGTNYLHDGNTNKGTKSVRFTPTLPWRADYRVYLRWTDGSNRATKTPVDIVSLAGTNTVYVNQTTNGGKWVFLGKFTFALGSLGSVTVCNGGTSAFVIADAVAFEAAFPIDPSFKGNPWADNDGDGICNYVEFLNGTDPNDASSFLKVNLDIHSGAAVLGLIAQAGRSYTIQYRDTFAPSPWLKLCDLTATNLAREVSITDPCTNAAPSRCYRIATPKVP
jgi:hypothetical protein